MSENKEKPSREQVIQWYKEEIELAALRSELAKHQRDAMVSEAERVQAIAVIAQITQDPGVEQEIPEQVKRKLKKEQKDPDDGC
jgi:hypothetical protein